MIHRNGSALLWLVTLVAVCNGSIHDCSREWSRAVRRVLQQRVYPVFVHAKADVPDGCPFNQGRDIYAVQEENKYMESLSKWHCDFCGKEFVSEFYLDQHFNNRHSEYIKRDDDTVCFADYCDIIRCDVVGGGRKADFWDRSLCLEDDMKELSQRCKNLMDTCIPNNLSKNMTEYVRENLYDGVCSFLTCKTYWDAPLVTESDGRAMYIVFSVFLVVFLVVYYCVAYHYFYTDTFSDSYDPHYYERHRQTFPLSSLRDSELRIRTGLKR